MKIIYLAIASEDPIHKRDEFAQLKTFVNDFDQDSQMFWLHGGSEKGCYIEGNHVYVDVDETYSNILAKTVRGIEYISQNCDFDILIRTNVSTYFDDSRIRKLLLGLNLTGNFFGGYVENCRDYFESGDKLISFVSGTGIFLSKDSARVLSRLICSQYRGIPDDVAISQYMKSQGQTITRIMRSNFSYLHILTSFSYIRLKSSTYPGLASERFYLISRMHSRGTYLSKVSDYISLHINEIKYLNIGLTGFLKYIQRLFVYLQYDLLTYMKAKVD